MFALTFIVQNNAGFEIDPCDSASECTLSITSLGFNTSLHTACTHAITNDVPCDWTSSKDTNFSISDLPPNKPSRRAFFDLLAANTFDLAPHKPLRRGSLSPDSTPIRSKDATPSKPSRRAPSQSEYLEHTPYKPVRRDSFSGILKS
jgi:hypothetical protein